MTAADQSAGSSHWSIDLLGSSPTVLSVLRRKVALVLADLEEDYLADVLLVAVELVSNAFDHSDGPREFRMTRTDTPCSIGIEVDDDSTASPVLGQSRFVREHRGRGLIVVNTLATSWGMTVHSGIKTVWAQVPCEQPRS